MALRSSSPQGILFTFLHQSAKCFSHFFYLYILIGVLRIWSTFGLPVKTFPAYCGSPSPTNHLISQGIPNLAGLTHLLSISRSSSNGPPASQILRSKSHLIVPIKQIEGSKASHRFTSFHFDYLLVAASSSRWLGRNRRLLRYWYLYLCLIARHTH